MRCNHIEHTLVLFTCEMFHYLGVSISTNDRRNALVIFAQRSRPVFSPKEEATSAHEAVNKQKLISKNLNENVKTHWF